MENTERLYQEENLAEILSLKEYKEGKIGNGKKHLPPQNRQREQFVEPIRSKNDVEMVINHLYKKALNAKRQDTMLSAYRDYMIFVVGINVGLRVSDLIKLQWKVFFEEDNQTFRDVYRVTEQKTGKTKEITINNMVKTAISQYLAATGFSPKQNEYVFLRSRKNENGTYDRIDDSVVEKMMKSVAKECGLKGNYNTHTLRKTYAYHKFLQYTEAGDPQALVKVQYELNHRNSSVTAVYLGITLDEKKKSTLAMDDYWGFMITEM